METIGEMVLAAGGMSYLYPFLGDDAQGNCIPDFEKELEQVANELDRAWISFGRIYQLPAIVWIYWKNMQDHPA